MSYQSEIITYQFQELFYNHFDKSIDKIERLKADASNRKIYRLISGYTSCVAVWNENVPENRAFVEFSKGFKRGGLNVPQIYNESFDYKFYLLEDYVKLSEMLMMEPPLSRVKGLRFKLKLTDQGLIDAANLKKTTLFV